MRYLIILSIAFFLHFSCTATNTTDIPEICDNNLETGIIINPKEQLVIFTGSDAIIQSYKVFSFDSLKYDPSGWILSGSNNGKQWQEIDKQDDVKFCSRFQEKLCILAEPVKFKFYQIKFMPSTDSEKVAISEVQFLERNIEKDWNNFIYPDVEFKIENSESVGAKNYSLVVHDPDTYAKFHARKVAEILFYDDNDSIHYIRKINYVLKDFEGVAYKTGSGDEIGVNFSTNHIESSAAESLYKLNFETRGVLFHELTHGYQYEPRNCGNYGSPDKIFWSFIEGVADAVRAESGHFDMITRKPGGNWLDGYRTTGFFIQWMTKDDPDAIRKFHKTALQLDTWSWDAAIKLLYGERISIDSKWEEYQQWLKSNENKNQIIYK